MDAFKKENRKLNSMVRVLRKEVESLAKKLQQAQAKNHFKQDGRVKSILHPYSMQN
jgi:prefoldin subunit 5